jgi:hypothetical protein
LAVHATFFLIILLFSQGEGCYLLVATASNEKAWAKLEPTLRSMVNAFRA